MFRRNRAQKHPASCLNSTGIMSAFLRTISRKLKFSFLKCLRNLQSGVRAPSGKSNVPREKNENPHRSSHDPSDGVRFDGSGSVEESTAHGAHVRAAQTG